MCFLTWYKCPILSSLKIKQVLQILQVSSDLCSKGSWRGKQKANWCSSYWLANGICFQAPASLFKWGRTKKGTSIPTIQTRKSDRRRPSGKNFLLVGPKPGAHLNTGSRGRGMPSGGSREPHYPGCQRRGNILSTPHVMSSDPLNSLWRAV